MADSLLRGAASADHTLGREVGPSRGTAAREDKGSVAIELTLMRMKRLIFEDVDAQENQKIFNSAFPTADGPHTKPIASLS